MLHLQRHTPDSPLQAVFSAFNEALGYCCSRSARCRSSNTGWSLKTFRLRIGLIELKPLKRLALVNRFTLKPSGPEVLVHVRQIA